LALDTFVPMGAVRMEVVVDILSILSAALAA
jgi:hypothetical protein